MKNFGPLTEEQKDEIFEEIIAYSNSKLLDEYTFYAGGDDYDGCHTIEGAYRYEILSEEIQERLKDWLKE